MLHSDKPQHGNGFDSGHVDAENSQARPPIGTVPDFIVEAIAQQQELSEQLDRLEYRTVLEHEDAVQVFDKLSAYTQSFAARYGVDIPPLDGDDIRVYESDQMTQLVALLPESENGGVFDAQSGLVHIERRHPMNIANNIMFFYAMAHEVGHKITPRLSKADNRLSFVMSEGVADTFSKEFVASLVPHLYPEVAGDTQDRLASIEQLPTIEGFPVDASDIIYLLPGAEGTEAGVFTRIPQMRAMGAIRLSIGDAAFAEFMRQALSKDAQAITFLSQQLGKEFWEHLDASTDGQISAVEVAEALGAAKKTDPKESYDAAADTILSNQERVAAGLATPLPDGFTYGHPADFSYAEIEDLLRTGYSEADVWSAQIPTRAESLAQKGYREIDIMVGHGKQLVGMASIIVKGSQGEMGNLVVHPDYQHKGLARILIQERLAEAEHSGVEAIYIPPLSDENTLESFYIEHGFKKNEDGSFVRGPVVEPLP